MSIHSIYTNSAQIKGIYQESINLVRNGWHVLANYISGFNSPPEIEGYTPDIYAVKGNLTYIILIENQNNIDPIKKTVLRKYTKAFKDMIFLVYIVNTAGCRISIEN
jgi:hypothetical protein